jgi:hypothetical protein
MIVVFIVGSVAGCHHMPTRAELWADVRAPAAAAQARHIGLDVTLQPSRHMIEGHVEIELELVETPSGRVGVELVLNSHLEIQRIDCPATELRWHGPAFEEDGTHRYIVVLESPPQRFSLTCTYGGTLLQDVDAGEIAGAIHNFGVHAHIAPEGIYLSEGSVWYPNVYSAPQAHPVATSYELSIAPIDGMKLVAGCPRARGDEGSWRWRSTHDLDGLAIAGGPHVVHRQTVGRIAIETHLRPEHAEFSAGLLAAVEAYLKLYEPLLGPYPYDEFIVVENFFSSGFAYPTFTLLGPEVIAMGQRGLRPGYLDHEMVHNWWGNGVFVDPRDGNWCEALTSYCTNYYRHVAEGRNADARKHRRNILNSLSSLPPHRDQPLGRFGIDDVSRTIGYQKGEMIFYELARRIGQETFFEALRDLRRSYTGRYADWNALQQAFERASGQDLQVFFDAWVHRGGLPVIALKSAALSNAGESQHVAVTMDCAGEFPAFDVPLRVLDSTAEPRTHVVQITPGNGGTTVTVPCGPAPLEIQLDPDFEVLRKQRSDLRMPVMTMAGRGQLTAIIPGIPGDVAESYTTLAAQYANSDGDRTVAVQDVQPPDLDERHLLILGDAVRHPQLRQLLSECKLPLSWPDTGFSLDGTRYADASESVMCTVKHPRNADAVIAIYYGNSQDALSNVHLLGFYANSLVVFRGGMPVARRDFEALQSIEVTPAP